jgi:uncharacterized protein HemY
MDPQSRGDVLRRRGMRAARRGEWRKSVVALRELVALEGRATDWVRLGYVLGEARRSDESLAAYHQGLYAYRRSGASKRARTVARLILASWPADAMARTAA